MDNVRRYLYYILVGVISVIMLVFMPMLGSSAGLQWVLPTTVAGWTVYVISKLCSAGFNIGLFHCFTKQGKLNIMSCPEYKAAQIMLGEIDKDLATLPRSPKQYYMDVYGKKGLAIFITTLLGTVGLAQSILTFDAKEFIVQLIALVVGLIMGVLQMKDTEAFWTEEFPSYVRGLRKEKEDVHD